MTLYAVHRGRTTGIFNTWFECKAQVEEFKNCCFKSFKNNADAKYFVKYGRVKPVRKITTFFKAIV